MPFAANFSLASCFQLRNARWRLIFLNRQAQRGCRDVLLQMSYGRSAGNGQHDGSALQKPGKCDLLGAGFMFLGDFVEYVAGNSASAKWKPRNKSDCVSFAIIHHVIPFSIRKTEAILNRNDWDNLSSPLDMLLRDIGKRYQPNFPLLFQPCQCSHRIVERPDRVGSMQLIDVDSFEPQPFEAALNGLAKMGRSRIMGPLIRPGTLPTTFGGDHKISRIGEQRLGNQLFTHVWTVGISRIDKVHAQFHSSTKHGQGRLAILGRSPNALTSETHGAEAEATNGKLATKIDHSSRVCRDCVRLHEILQILNFNFCLGTDSNELVMLLVIRRNANWNPNPQRIGPLPFPACRPRDPIKYGPIQWPRRS